MPPDFRVAVAVIAEEIAGKAMERAAKAICSGCSMGMPVVKEEWCDCWHPDDPTQPTLGMPCRAAAIRGLK